jgi:NAD(P)-dependent dehydrogenase (short-subunit alcohol dehydrogenase family)
VGNLDAGAIAAAFATNVAAPVVMADLFFRSFPDDTVERRIINVSSGAAQTAIAGTLVYGMSKAALEMCTRAIVAECSTPRFRCISLRPGIFETGMQAYMRSRDPAEFPSAALFRGFKDNGLLKDPADVAARIVEKLVLSRSKTAGLGATALLNGCCDSSDSRGLTESGSRALRPPRPLPT